MTRIILGDDQAIFRAGIAKVLSGVEDFRVAAQCADLDRLLLAIEAYPGGVVVFASTLKARVPDLITRIRAAGSRAVLIAETQEPAMTYIQMGVRGVVHRDSTDAALITCVHSVIQGITWVERSKDGSPHDDEDFVGARVRDRLTPKEMKVLALIAQGRRNKEIAQLLGTSEQVIKNYLRKVFDKTGVSDRLELALFTFHHRNLAAAAAEAVSSSLMQTA